MKKTLTLADLTAGIKIPAKTRYIDALEADIEIQPVSLERYNEFKTLESATVEAEEAAAETGEDQELQALITAQKEAQRGLLVCIAEGLSGDSEMSFEQAEELCENVRKKIPPIAWEQIAAAVASVMFGDRVKKI